MKRLAALCLSSAVLLLGIACSDSPPKGAAELERMDRQAAAFASGKRQEKEVQDARLKKEKERVAKAWAEYNAKAMRSQAARPPKAAAGQLQQSQQPQTPVYVLPDKDLSFLVLNKIRFLISRPAISVSCKDGVVQLFGEVPSAEIRNQLLQDIRKLPGVLKVESTELVVAGGDR